MPNTPPDLWTAIDRGNMKWTLKFLEEDPSLALDTEYLDHAVAKGRAKIVKLLFDHGMKIGSDEEATYLAADDGNIEILALLLEHGIDLRARNDLALLSALDANQPEAARFLLSKGAVIPPDDDDFTKTRNLAAGRGHLEIYELFLEHGPAEERTNDRAALCEAARGGQIEMIKRILAEGLDDFGSAPDIAAEEGQTEAMLLLIDDKTDLDYLLERAAKGGKAQTVLALLAKGANRYASSHSAMKQAVLWQRREVVALLASLAGPDAGSSYKQHRERFAAQTKEMTALPMEKRLAALCDAEGKPSEAMRLIAASDTLDRLFAPAAWPGEDGRRTALALHATLRENMPEYRTRIEKVDLIPFQERAETFVGALAASRVTPIPTARR